MSKIEKCGKRIYVVVPGTVQTPIKFLTTGAGGLTKQIAGRCENTRDIVQPAGRQAMQIGHVRGMVEHHLIQQDIAAVSYDRRITRKSILENIQYHIITGIALACRDSFELIHIQKMLDAAKILRFVFYDTQEGLYEDVATALATVPVGPFDVAGILDYLPLWGK